MVSSWRVGRFEDSGGGCATSNRTLSLTKQDPVSVLPHIYCNIHLHFLFNFPPLNYFSFFSISPQSLQFSFPRTGSDKKKKTKRYLSTLLSISLLLISFFRFRFRDLELCNSVHLCSSFVFRIHVLWDLGIRILILQLDFLFPFFFLKKLG